MSQKVPELFSVEQQQHSTGWTFCIYGEFTHAACIFFSTEKFCIRVNHFISTFMQPLTSWCYNLKQELKWIKHCYEPKLRSALARKRLDVLWLPPGVAKSHGCTCLSNRIPINLLKPQLDIVNCRVTAGGAVCRAVLGHSQCRARWSDPKIKDSVFVLTQLANTLLLNKDTQRSHAVWASHWRLTN